MGWFLLAEMKEKVGESSVMNYQLVLVRGDERRVVARFASLQEAKNVMGIYRTSLGRYVLEEAA